MNKYIAAAFANELTKIAELKEPTRPSGMEPWLKGALIGGLVGTPVGILPGVGIGAAIGTAARGERWRKYRQALKEYNRKLKAGGE